MFQYYNAHPHQAQVGDCVKRAIAVAMGMDYMDVQRELNQHKKITGAKQFNSDGNPQSYVETVLGFQRVTIPDRGDETGMTADKFCKIYPKGRYIITMSGHWSAVINGTILDTWDCGNERLHSYYAVTPIQGLKKIPIRYGFIIRLEVQGKASVSFYDGNGNSSIRMISADHIDGYRACLLNMGYYEAIDWEDEKWK